MKAIKIATMIFLLATMFHVNAQDVGRLAFFFSAPAGGAVANGRLATCTSNVVTMPAPAGWHDSHRQSSVFEEADRIMEPFRRDFIAKCKQHGGTQFREGSVGYIRNGGTGEDNTWERQLDMVEKAKQLPYIIFIKI